MRVGPLEADCLHRKSVQVCVNKPSFQFIFHYPNLTPIGTRILPCLVSSPAKGKTFGLGPVGNSTWAAVSVAEVERDMGFAGVLEGSGD